MSGSTIIIVYVPESFSVVPTVGADAVSFVDISQNPEFGIWNSLPAFGISTPLTASTFPNATVKFLDDAGSKPAGVNAATALVSEAVIRILENIFPLRELI